MTNLGPATPERSKGRRILLVSYHFGAGCPTGGFRWNATAAYLCSRGWDVDVITAARPGLDQSAAPAGPGRLEIFPVEPAHWPARAREATLGLGRSLRSLVAPSEREGKESATRIDPTRLFIWRTGYRRSLRHRLLNGVDFAEKALSELIWSARAVRVGRSLRGRCYRAIVASTPPHLTQCAGARLARDLGVPYVADYRDPWILGLREHVGYVNDLERIVGRYFEARLLRLAHTVIHNTEWARTAISAELTIPGDHHAIPNGYDETQEVVDAPDPDCFRIVYTGHLYAFMDVRPVFVACAHLRQQHDLGPSNLRIDFVGTSETFEGVRLAELAEAYGLADVFVWHPRVSRSEAAAFQSAASVLVAFDWLFPIAVVSKFYEYARMKGRMLLLGNPEGALADAAAKLGLAVIHVSDQRRIDECLEATFGQWKRGELDRPMDRDRCFDRMHQSERIRELLERLQHDRKDR